MVLRKNFIFGFLFCALFGLTGCGDSSDKNKIREVKGLEKTLTMVTSADNPPYEYFEGGDAGKIIGFDINLVQEIAQYLGIKIEVEDRDFNGLISSVQSGRADLAMASLTITPERAQNVDFSTSYIRNQVAIVIKSEHPEITADNIAGKKIGVQLGTPHDEVLQKLTPKGEVKIVHLNKLGELIQEVRADRIDGVMMDLRPAIAYVQRNKDLKYVHIRQGDTETGIAFAKGSPWVAKFNEAIEALKKNGTIDRLVEKWLQSKDKM
jgi:polar amino acid transport system substrate-binding protein